MKRFISVISLTLYCFLIASCGTRLGNGSIPSPSPTVSQAGGLREPEPETESQNLATPGTLPRAIPPTEVDAQGQFRMVNDCYTIRDVDRLPLEDETLVLYEHVRGQLLLQPPHEDPRAIGKIQIASGALSDTQKIAYIDSDLKQLILIDANGKEYFRKSVPDGWVEILGWSARHQLLISDMPFIGSENRWWPPSNTVILDLTGEQKSVEIEPTKYPDVDIYLNGIPNFGRFSYSVAAYDPTLTRVVYPSRHGTVILFDVEHQTTVASLFYDRRFSEPIWDASGESFFISAPIQFVDTSGVTRQNVPDPSTYFGGNELFQVSRDGKIDRLTYLTTQSYADERVYIQSPDGQKIAFQYTTQEKGTFQIAIFDLKTNAFTNTCVNIGDDSYDMFWLEDGHRVILSVPGEPKKKNFLLVDLESKEVFRTPGGPLTILGWLQTPQ